ncbi:hypothetical protein C8R45DRAFT_1082424 [Mycena sanguinolenta]|nr:hypothetical protein C8R45DRAFT_1082424 [Mycena sanguinolenta]
MRMKQIRYYCEGSRTVTHEEHVIDEPNTANTWAEYESQLPNPYPHCFLPFHFWLDDGLVTKRITMHPFVFRALCLTNSGHGTRASRREMYSGRGDTSVRDTKDYRKVCDPSDPSSRNALQTEEFAQYKMEVYQKVLAVVFSSLKSRSWSGEPIRCPDGVVRIFHSGIMIDPLDGKEGAYFCACRAAKANFPCPKCLVPKSSLHNITGAFKLRTIPNMKAVVLKANKCKTKTKKADILKGYGLHDGRSFYDILKCVLPCIVQLLPANVTLVHWIRAYECCRIMAGMECMPESRLQRLGTFIKDYEYWSGQVSEAYGKDFDFFKQHSLNHLVRDIRDKGTTNHSSTRPGEGFQQEAHEAYSRTNRKNAAHQAHRESVKQEKGSEADEILASRAFFIP